MDGDRTESDWQGLVSEYLVCKRKLESKKEALLILSKELDTCQQERDQYKLMANQLRERHQSLKKKYRELIVSLAMEGYLVPTAKTGKGAVIISSFQKPPLANSLPSSQVYAWNPSLGGGGRGIRNSRPSLAT